jgi:hypothetical protein
LTVLYHYCSTSNFVSIVSSQSIWLSSLSLSNDTMEGRLVSKIIDRLANRDGLTEQSINEILGTVGFLEALLDGLGFCLSLEGDLLSQWRGYAANATGFSIGFSKEYLLSLSESLKEKEDPGFFLVKVEYEIKEQEELIRSTYENIKQIIDSDRLKLPRPRGLLDQRSDEDIEKELEEFKKSRMIMLTTAMELVPKLYAIKTAAFREEREWRLISHLLRKEESCLYRALDDRIVPYKVFDLAKLDAEPIIEVKIGPKNQTPIYVVKSFLTMHGFKNTTVSQSSATLR